MLAEERRQQILEQITRDGSVNVLDLCERFQVSDMTIRRDLVALEQQGLLLRVYGGAVSPRRRSYEPPFLLRQGQQSAEKQHIGLAAAALIQEGDSVALDVGTTSLEIARALIGRNNLTIVTPSLRVAQVLADQPGLRLIVTGGIVRAGEHSLVGNLVERTFRELFVDKLFLGIGGVDFEAGLTEFNLEDALAKQAMLASAKERIVVADSSKFGQVAFAKVAPLAQVHRIVTDEHIAPELLDRLRELHIDVILAHDAKEDAC